MNGKFSDNQIEAYAAAFEEGDAIFCYGEWQEVKRSPSFTFLKVETSGYIIKDTESEEEGVIVGFKDANCPYRVTTLEHYELKGGEMLVWLGNSNNFNFGEVYEVKYRPESEASVFVYDSEGYVRTPKSKCWAVIPKYEQVQSIERNEVKTSDIVNTLYKRYYAGIQNMLHDDIQNALTDGDYQKVIKLSKMMMEMEGVR